MFLISTGLAKAEEVNSAIFNYQSTLSQDEQGPLDLIAELNYNSDFVNAPIVVVMHGYSTGTLVSMIRPQAQSLRDAGFFAISVTMRGREGSDGIRDSGGLEIYDIIDAVEAIKTAFPGLVDPGNLNITGFSGGGGNVMSALTKFPDYFRVGSSFYGMSDYGYDPVVGWYNAGAAQRTAQLDLDIGNPNTGDPLVLDRYLARASNLAGRNNPYAEIHLFTNSDDTTVPAINTTRYRDNALPHASFEGEFDNIHVHIGDSSGNTYVDFDQSGTFELDEQQNWPHGGMNANRQAAAEQWYRDRMLDGSIAQPVLHATDHLFVAGYVVTKPFTLFLGSGEDTAGELNYSLSPQVKSFSLELLTSDLTKTGKLTIDTSDMDGQGINVMVNGLRHSTIIGGGTFIFEGFGHNQTIELNLMASDLDGDGDTDDADFSTAFAAFTGPVGEAGGRTAADGDMDSDGDVDDADLGALFANFTGPMLPNPLPEPATAAVLLGLGAVLVYRRRRPAQC